MWIGVSNGYNINQAREFKRDLGKGIDQESMKRDDHEQSEV